VVIFAPKFNIGNIHHVNEKGEDRLVLVGHQLDGCDIMVLNEKREAEFLVEVKGGGAGQNLAHGIPSIRRLVLGSIMKWTDGKVKEVLPFKNGEDERLWATWMCCKAAAQNTRVDSENREASKLMLSVLEGNSRVQSVIKRAMRFQNRKRVLCYKMVGVFSDKTQEDEDHQFILGLLSGESLELEQLKRRTCFRGIEVGLVTGVRQDTRYQLQSKSATLPNPKSQAEEQEQEGPVSGEVVPEGL